MVVRRVSLSSSFPISLRRVADRSTSTRFPLSSSKREFTSFDTPNVAATKARYIRDQGLGGAMFWELDAVRSRSSSFFHAVSLSSPVFQTSHSPSSILSTPSRPTGPPPRRLPRSSRSRPDRR